MQIFVKNITLKTLELEVAGEDTIESIKQQIQLTYEIPIHQQRLMYEGVYLRSDKTLIFYKIQDQAILHLVVRVLGTMKVIVKVCCNKTIITITRFLFCQLQTGEELDYEVNPKDKVSDFLDDIKVDIDLEGGYHAFIFKGRPVRQSHTFDQAGIIYGSVLNLTWAPPGC